MRRRYYLVAVSLLLGVVIPAALVAQVPTRPATFDLVGIVRAEVSGHPMPGVLIVVDSSRSHRVVTDSAGRYRITGLPRGSYTVSARRLGYYVERREITVTCPVVVTDEHGKVLSDGGPCDPSPATLNFYLRPHTVR
ncbi:MAG TPA: carboxypeptidase-like regulatory domain-containing protein [Gemmatimonadaceae bacterium]|nr:carboxypeptidase-like regulatory domain-containing protein [Gemmatimonadaceae bacterium]